MTVVPGTRARDARPRCTQRAYRYIHKYKPTGTPCTHDHGSPPTGPPIQPPWDPSSHRGTHPATVGPIQPPWDPFTRSFGPFYTVIWTLLHGHLDVIFSHFGRHFQPFWTSFSAILHVKLEVKPAILHVKLEVKPAILDVNPAILDVNPAILDVNPWARLGTGPGNWCYRWEQNPENTV